MLTTTTRAAPDASIKRGYGMSMSPGLAEGVFSAANWVLVAALVVGVLATYAIVVSGNVKEAHWKRQAAEAQARGSEASARSAAAVAEAQARVTEAKAESAAAILEIAKAYERTAVLEKEAAEARAEQERIKERMAGRRITSDQHNVIVSFLKQHPMSIIVGHTSNDPEAAVYAEDICTMLQAAGSTITKSDFNGPEPIFGIELMPTGANDPDADRISAAFGAAGVSMKIGPAARFLTINVWNKPPPF